MARISVFWGVKYIHHIFLLPMEKYLIEHYMAEISIKSTSKSGNIECPTGIGNSVSWWNWAGTTGNSINTGYDIAMIFDNHIFMGRLLVISTTEHTQLQPVNGKQFYCILVLLLVLNRFLLKHKSKQKNRL